ncbi:MAG TPA: hypothetical protein DCP92_12925 [Nitrospiraceae bacterium]|nr:hypothetical protein [Nitrospiraceae bacterium]
MHCCENGGLFSQNCKTFEVKYPLNSIYSIWHGRCILKGKNETEEDKEMKTRETAKKTAYIGAGAGLVLFAVIGLLPGSFIGGVVGLNIAGGIFGLPLTSALLPRLIVGISMLLGIFVSALIFIASCSILGWLVGSAIDSLNSGKALPLEAKVKY